jgi:cell division protein FtsI (penicillin-binding protein 3)
MSGRTDRRGRMIALILVFTLFGSATVLRLGQFQVVDAPVLRAKAQRVMPRALEPDTIRADILDRSGTPLAQTHFRDRLVAHPDLMNGEPDLVIDELAVALGMSPAEANVRYGKQLADASDQYEVLEPRLTPEQSLAVHEARVSGRLPGIALQPTQVRIYPNPGGEPETTLANQLIGFVDASGDGNKGVEQWHDGRLTGAAPPGQQAVASLAGVDLLGSGADLGPPALRLTLDAGLQAQLETELQAARTANGSKSVSGIIMDADTGAILAWATVPGYDANDFRSVAARGIDHLRDPIVADTYEPGSVMKSLTATAALVRGVVTPKTHVLDSDELPFEGAIVRNADHGGLGRISVTKAIAYSRNVATARIAAKLGPSVARASSRLHDAWRLLGIGDPTGVDLASEEVGIVPDPAQRAWAPVDLANRAFGQGVNVTLVQLARAFAAMANGGYLVTPHVSLEIDAEIEKPRRVLAPRVARQIREILEYVTAGVPHYARGTLIPGYQVGGKTGTAQIWDNDRKRYKKKRFDFSFVGFVGRDDPEVIIAVRLADTPPDILGQGELMLKVTSYELFRRIARVTIRELRIPRSKDPLTGYPIPGSEADRMLTDKKFQPPTRVRSGQRGDRRADGERTTRERAGDQRADDARAGERRSARERAAGERGADARRADGGARAGRDRGSRATANAAAR